MKNIELNLKNFYQKSLKISQDKFMEPLGMQFSTLVSALEYSRKKPDFELFYKLKHTYPTIDLEKIMAEEKIPEKKKPVRQQAKASTGKPRTHQEESGVFTTIKPLDKEAANLLKIQVGKNMRTLRLNKNISLADVGTHMGMYTSNLSQLERGKINVNAPSIIQLCKILGCTTDQLLISPDSTSSSASSGQLQKNK